MNKKTYLRWLVPGIVLLSLLLWRLWPRSVYALLDAPKEEIHLGYMAMVETVFEAGRQETVIYQVGTEDLHGELLAQLLSILEGKGFRPDLRNLLPWKDGELHAAGQMYTVSIHLSWGTGPSQAGSLIMLEPETVGISAGGDFGVYHPADRNTREKLYQFAVTYGEVQE